MAHGPVEPPRGRARFGWWLSLITGGLSFVLSLIAFCSSLGWSGVGEALYSSAALLLLHLPHEAPTQHDELSLAHIALSLARPLAVIAAAATGVSLVWEFFGRELRRWWQARRGNHVVICGLSRTGQRLVEAFCHAGDTVLVIDEGANQAAVVKALEAGAGLLLGNVTDRPAMRKAGIHRARYVYATMDDTGSNVGIALNAIATVQEQPASRAAGPHLFVHIADPPLRALLRRHRAFRADGRRPRVSLFNVFEESARLLLLNDYLDYVRIAEDDERVVQIVVVGFGMLGQEVLTRAAMVGHYANRKWLRAIIIDHQAVRKESSFRTRYPQFGEVCNAQFLPLDADNPSTHAQIAAWCGDAKKTISTVVICLDNDTRGLSLALSLSKLLGPDVPIRVRLNEQSGLAALLQESNAGITLPSQIIAFGSLHESGARKTWDYDELDRMAKAVHADYVRRRREQNPTSTDDRSMRDWEQLDDDLIDSNRQLADHIPVKLRAIGCHIARRDSKDPGRLVKEFTDPQIELLAKMEHQRWMAERFLAGWVLGPRDIEDRSSPFLVSWEQVPPQIQAYDRDFARILPGVLDLVNLEIRQ
jgi:voltage-gated potassium channel Kch